MEPGGREPAPGALALVQQFINTRDIEAATDALDSPERLARWLAANALMPADVPADDDGVGRARALRESLRALIETNHAPQPTADAVAGFNKQAGCLMLLLQADVSGRLTLAPATGGVDGALARLIAIVAEAVFDHTWERLKVCPADTCRWVFYDHSKNRSGAWCSMAICGNRAKVRAYQRRRRAPV